MKRVLIIAAVFLACMIFSNAYAAVQDLTGKNTIGISTGGAFPLDEDMDNTWYVVNGNYAYNINNNLAVGGEIGYLKWEFEEDGVDYGDLHGIPLLADFYLRYPIDAGEQMVLPYAVGGIGAIFWNFEESSLLEDAGITADVDTALALKIGAGLDYFVTKQVAFNLEGAYVWSETEMTASAAGAVVSSEADTDFWTLTGGVKYCF